MAEYLKKDKAIDIFIEGDGDDEFTEGYNFAVNEYREKIRAIPATEVQPVKHGRWEQIGEQSAQTYKMKREQLCSQQIHCLSCPLSVLRTGRDCHEIKEDIMK